MAKTNFQYEKRQKDLEKKRKKEEKLKKKADKASQPDGTPVDPEETQDDTEGTEAIETTESSPDPVPREDIERPDAAQVDQERP